MRLRKAVFLVWGASGCAGRASVEQPAPAAVAATPMRSITLERMRCYGTCPAYNVTLKSDGSVRYEGIANVATQSVREWRVPPDSATMVFRYADSVRFADLPERYEFGAPGCTPYIAEYAAFVITVTATGQSRRVHADEGCANVPATLLALRSLIDRTTGVERAVYLRP